MSRAPAWRCKPCGYLLGFVRGGVLELCNGVILSLCRGGATVHIICPQCGASREAVTSEVTRV